MSDYLVNLARRSAGLAVVLRARSAPVIEAPATSGTAEDAVAARVPRPAAPIAVMPQPAPGRVPGPASAPPPSVAAPAPAPLAIALAAVAQRAIAPGAPPVVLPAPVIGHPTETAAVGPRPQAPPDTEAGLVVVPAAIVRAALPENADPPPARGPREEPAVPAPILERVIVTEAGETVPVVVPIPPLDRTAPAWPAARAELPLERTVHVRIGAIEIYGAEDETRPSAAPAPVAATSSAGRMAAPGGFDEFAALRSYAPWAW